MVALSSELNGVKRSIDESQDSEEVSAKKAKALEENGDEVVETIVRDKATSAKPLGHIFEALKTSDFSKITRQV
jgi:hypothetical protein